MEGSRTAVKHDEKPLTHPKALSCLLQNCASEKLRLSPSCCIAASCRACKKKRKLSTYSAIMASPTTILLKRGPFNKKNEDSISSSSSAPAPLASRFLLEGRNEMFLRRIRCSSLQPQMLRVPLADMMESATKNWDENATEVKHPENGTGVKN